MSRDPEQLPLFEGHKPDTSEIKLTGATPGRRKAFRIGQTAYFLVRGIVRGVTHEKKKSSGAMVRSHKLEILGAEQVDVKGIVADALVADASAYLATVNDEEEKGKQSA